VPRSAFVDGAVAVLAGRGDAVVLRYVRGNVEGAKVGDVISGVIGLVFARRYTPTGPRGFGLEHDTRSTALGRARGKM
jgi:hypothetical protein